MGVIIQIDNRPKINALVQDRRQVGAIACVFYLPHTNTMVALTSAYALKVGGREEKEFVSSSNNPTAGSEIVKDNDEMSDQGYDEDGMDDLGEDEDGMGNQWMIEYNEYNWDEFETLSEERPEIDSNCLGESMEHSAVGERISRIQPGRVEELSGLDCALLEFPTDQLTLFGEPDKDSLIQPSPLPMTEEEVFVVTTSGLVTSGHLIKHSNICGLGENQNTYPQRYESAAN